MKIPFKTPVMALAATCAALAALPAAAQDRSVAVPYADLNLATPEGQAALDQRINRAARQVCGLDEVRTGTRLRSNIDRECFRQARTQVKQQVAAALAQQQLGG